MDQRLMVLLETVKENGKFSFSVQYGVPFQAAYDALDEFKAEMQAMEKAKLDKEAEMKAKAEAQTTDQG